MLYVAGVEKRLLQLKAGFSLKYLEKGKEVKWVLSGLTFADDIVLTVETVEDLQQLLDLCATDSATRHLRFNANRSSVFQFSGPAETTVCSLRLRGKAVPVESAYKYL